MKNFQNSITRPNTKSIIGSRCKLQPTTTKNLASVFL